MCGIPGLTFILYHILAEIVIHSEDVLAIKKMLGLVAYVIKAFSSFSGVLSAVGSEEIASFLQSSDGIGLVDLGSFAYGTGLEQTSIMPQQTSKHCPVHSIIWQQNASV